MKIKWMILILLGVALGWIWRHESEPPVPVKKIYEVRKMQVIEAVKRVPVILREHGIGAEDARITAMLAYLERLRANPAARPHVDAIMEYLPTADADAISIR